MENQHFTAKKIPGGWKVYRGTPENLGYYLTYKTHSNDVFDYCTSLAESYQESAQIHFDTRGAS